MCLFLAALGLCYCAKPLSSCSKQEATLWLQRLAFSFWWLLLLWSSGSNVQGLSSCGAWAYLLRGMWNPPGPRMEPVSPELAGGLIPTGPQGKSSAHILIFFFFFFY